MIDYDKNNDDDNYNYSNANDNDDVFYISLWWRWSIFQGGVTTLVVISSQLHQSLYPHGEAQHDWILPKGTKTDCSAEWIQTSCKLATDEFITQEPVIWEWSANVLPIIFNNFTCSASNNYWLKWCWLCQMNR